MRITGDGTINDRHSGEQLGPVFGQENQSTSTDRNHQIGRPLPIFVPKKIPLPLLLLLARETGHIEEFTVNSTRFLVPTAKAARMASSMMILAGSSRSSE